MMPRSGNEIKGLAPYLSFHAICRVLERALGIDVQAYVQTFINNFDYPNAKFITIATDGCEIWHIPVKGTDLVAIAKRASVGRKMIINTVLHAEWAMEHERQIQELVIKKLNKQARERMKRSGRVILKELKDSVLEQEFQEALKETNQ